MKQKKQNEELQSRREFFKKAAKAALPVIGVIIWGSMQPINAQTMPVTGCGAGDCRTSCAPGCGQGCSGKCSGKCTRMCMESCTVGCTASCGYTCSKGAR